MELTKKAEPIRIRRCRRGIRASVYVGAQVSEVVFYGAPLNQLLYVCVLKSIGVWCLLLKYWVEQSNQFM